MWLHHSSPEVTAPSLLTLTLSHLTSPCFLSPHLVSSHFLPSLTSPYVVLHFASCHLVSSLLTYSHISLPPCYLCLLTLSTHFLLPTLVYSLTCHCYPAISHFISFLHFPGLLVTPYHLSSISSPPERAILAIQCVVFPPQFSLFIPWSHLFSPWSLTPPCITTSSPHLSVAPSLHKIPLYTNHNPVNITLSYRTILPSRYSALVSFHMSLRIVNTSHHFSTSRRTLTFLTQSLSLSLSLHILPS